MSPVSDIRRMLAELFRLRHNPRTKRMLAPSPEQSKFGAEHSPRRINALLSMVPEPKRYLEIGVHRGKTIEAVRSKDKTGVEPFPDFNLSELPAGTQVHVQRSRDFFRSYSGPAFDFIFVDGLHEAGEAYLDVLDSLNVISEGGIILLDDVLPSDEASSLPSKSEAVEAQQRLGIVHGRWFGDVWRVAALIKDRYPDLHFLIVGQGNDDHSQGVILKKKGARVHFSPSDSDRNFMSSLDFNQTVFRSARALSKSATREEDAIRDIRTLLAT